MIRKRFNKKQIALGIISAIFVIFILTFYIWPQIESIRIGYETRELEKKVSVMKEEVEKLQTKRAALLSLGRVEKIAKEKLKLAAPREKQLIYEDLNPDP